MIFRTSKSFKAILVSFLLGTIVLLFSLGCRSEADAPPGNTGKGTNGNGTVTDDHGNIQARATPVTNGMPIDGNIETGDDQDYFSITVPGAGELQATTIGAVDTLGHLFDSEENELAADDNGGTDLNFEISYRITTPGTYYVRVTSEGSGTGIYRLSIIFVLDDHSNTQAQATPVTVGATIAGNIEIVDDQDYFSIVVSGAGTLTAATTGDVDTLGHLFDSEGNELAADDNGGTDLNFEISYRITTPGTYYVRVTSKDMDTGMYRLSVIFVPDDTYSGRANAILLRSGMVVHGNINPGTDEDYFAIAVSGAGTLIATTTGTTDTIGHLYNSDGDELAADDNGGIGLNFDISYTITNNGTYYIRVTSAGMDTGIYRLSVIFVPDEHGNAQAQATPVTVGTAIAGNIETGDDQDYFSVPLSEVGMLTATTKGTTDTIGYLYDSDGNQLATDDNSGFQGRNFEVSARIASTGTYYIGVASSGSDTGMYRLSVSFIADDHGNDRTSATPVTSGAQIAGNRETGADQDYFSIQVPSAGTLIARSTGSTDIRGTLYDGAGARLAVNDDAIGTNFWFSYQITSSGTYYVNVDSFGGLTGVYTLTVTFIADHGDTQARATPVISGTEITGNIETSDDQDYFSIVVAGAGTLRATTTGLTDTIGHLYDSSGTQLATDDDGGTDTNFDTSYSITTAGTYYARVISKGMDTGAYGLTVTFTPPDHGNDRMSATSVTIGTSVTGNIDPGTDEDYFSIQAPSAGTLTARSTGTTDTIGTLYDSDGNELAMDDDAVGVNFEFSYQITSAGTYYVRVTSFSTDTVPSTGMYTLTTTFIADHGDTAAHATSVANGMTITGNIETGTDEDYFLIQVTGINDLTLLRASTTGATNTIGHLYDSDGNQLATDDNGGTDTNFEISYSRITPGTYYVRVTSEGMGTGVYSLTVTSVHFDHSDTRDRATQVTSGMAINGDLETNTDEDYFSIVVTGAGTLRASTTGTTDTLGTLYDSEGTQLAMNDDAVSTNFDFSHQITTPGTYYVRVTAFRYAGAYSLTVTFTPSM